jgi:molybdate transport system substrate-binding protein
MLNGKMKKWALGLSTALVMISAPAYAQTIRLGAASGFAAAANDLTSAFSAYYANYGLSYNVTVNADTPQNLEANIIAGGTTGPYDLFLSTDKKEPHQLEKNYPSLVIGTPFKFAEDFLLLYSQSVPSRLMLELALMQSPAMRLPHHAARSML